jgi:hypothetical protein
MSMMPGHDHTDVPVVVGRRSTRLSVAVPISLTGTDPSGGVFREHTFTLSVNKHGAEIATSHQLSPESEIVVENLNLSLSSRARVIRRRERRSANSPYEVSVELLDPGNIWGVRFPPTDWEKAPAEKSEDSAAVTPAAEQTKTFAAAPSLGKSEPAEAATPPAESTAEATRPPAPSAEKPATEAPEPVTQAREPELPAATAAPDEAPAMPPPQPKVSAERQATPIPARVPEPAPQLEERVAPEPAPGDEKSSGTAGVAGVQEPPPAQAEPASTEQTARMVRSFEQRLHGMVDLLQASSEELEKLLSKAQQVRGTLQSEIGDARAEIQEAGRHALSSATDRLDNNLQSALAAACSRFAEETEKRLQEALSKGLEDFGKQAAADGSKATEETGKQVRAVLAQAVESFNAQTAARTSRLAEESASQLAAKLNQAVEGAKNQIGKFTEKVAAESAEKLGKSAVDSTAELIRAEQSQAVEDARNKINRHAEGVMAEAAQQLRNSVEDSTAELLRARQTQAVEEAGNQIRQVVEAATAEFAQKLRKSAETTTASLQLEMKDSIENWWTDFANRQLQSLHNQAQATLQGEDSPLKKLRRQMELETGSAAAKFRETCAHESQRAAAKVAEDAEKARESLRGTSQESRAGLSEAGKTIQHDLEVTAGKLTKGLAEFVTASEDGFRKYLEAQVKGTQEEVELKLRAAASQGAKDFNERIQKSANSTLEATAAMFSQQAESTMELSERNLEGAAKELLEETSGRLSALRAQTLEALSGELQAAAEQFRAQIRNSFREFVEESRRELERILKTAGEEQQQAIVGQIEAKGGEAIARLLPEIKSRSEAAAQDATEKVYKQMGVATVVLKDWGDQAAARLETQFQKAMDLFEKRVQETSQTALESHRREAREAMKEVHSRLEQAAQILRSEPAQSPEENSSPSSADPESKPGA